MRNIYFSFLGLGIRNKETMKYYYSPTTYELNGKLSPETEFVQVAEISLLDASPFDEVFITATQKSYDAHFKSLRDQLTSLISHISPIPIILEEDMTPEGQWKWFEKILSHIEPGDHLTIDLTHGYRSIPIVFSAAINFLQKARNISLNAVYYGVFERKEELGYAPIVDMKEFYLINEWADGVSRLVEDADARKMADVAGRSKDFQAAELNDEKVIKAFDDLTNTIRNVDVNNVASKANQAIQVIKEKKKNASETGKILFDLVIDKFITLTTDIPVSGKYDEAYFKVQIEIIKMLLKHKLFMQAYTVMREFVASIGMLPFEMKGISNKKRKKKRTEHAEVFVKMFQREEENWDFKNKAEICNQMMPFYRELEKAGVEAELRIFVKELAQYRNGFDHAWTSKAKAYEDIEEKGEHFFLSLQKLLSLLQKNQMLI